ncbi:class I SAM-dependent methyltransferase [Sphaerisporangium corydalis]|uniref:Class I SAM-dependent methyltransferase n=1 Tax=Sphaerisporangium corydalis TaxID=1441875 RepID=A0ABV9EH78_9ACTN|nr:class I SAM-dependent methyltransferase [Sphaerisporangium corydalis]
MSRLNALRSRFVDAPDSLGAKARARRWNWFAESFPDLSSMSVIDLGGTASAWLRAPVQPAHVQIVNLETPPADLPGWLRADVADACALPPGILDTHYDLVFSNAVIEHVGGHLRRRMFADSVHRLAERHWVQTPYRYFPVEPHFLFPGFQYLPIAARTALLRRWPLVHTPTSDREAARNIVMEVELLSITEMRHYFPSSEIRFERLGGLVKSVLAIKEK